MKNEMEKGVNYVRTSNWTGREYIPCGKWLQSIMMILHNRELGHTIVVSNYFFYHLIPFLSFIFTV